MRALVRWLNHRDAVLDNLNAILLVYPPRRQFAFDFPKLKSLIRAHFDDGISPATSASLVAEGIIGHFVEQLDPGERVTVLEALLGTGQAGFAEIADLHVKGLRKKAPDNVSFVTNLAGVAILMVGRLTKDARFSGSDRFMLSVASALGADAAQRRLLEKAFHHQAG